MTTVQEKIDHLNISEILLDPLNPRLGEEAQQSSTQEQIVSKIINDFGIDDLLSSMAFNGYFEAEPLVCQIRNGQYYVIEGNRRLVACLVLSGDPRAENYLKHFAYARNLHNQKENPNVTHLPVVIFDENASNQKISAYLGIRHIVSTKDWDSFAKARWIHETILQTGLSISDISQMTGDKSNAIKSLLSGYNFMNQLEREGKFNRNNTVRKGRGSNVSYPFSWVYTLFNHSAPKEYLEVKFFDDNNLPNEIPIPQHKLDDASFVIEAMFGNLQKGKDSVLKDSREITSFADALSNPQKVFLLKAGKSLQEVSNLTTSIKSRLEEIFFQSMQLFAEANIRITTDSDKVTSDIIQDGQEKIIVINKLLKSIHGNLEEIKQQKNNTNLDI